MAASVSAIMAYRISVLRREAQAFSLGRMERDDFNFKCGEAQRSDLPSPKR